MIAVALQKDRLDDFCRRWRVAELALFGSALREDFGTSSDVDFLVSFAPEANWSLLDHIQMERELSELVGRPVDLVSRSALERNHNSLRRRHILGSAETVYVAR